jgi:uncharacterized membrane protein
MCYDCLSLFSVDWVHAAQAGAQGNLSLTNQVSPKRTQRILERELTQQNAGLSRDRETRPTSGPTKPSPKPPGLGSALARNIQTMERRRDREEVTATLEVRVADAITRFTGSMRFVYLHLALFGLWIILNLGLIPGVPLFDPSFVILAMVASVEAIFLSTFILISQNRMAAAADKRADLDLQINLLSEHEVTKLIALVSSIADRMGVKTEVDPEVDELKQDVAPEAVLDEIEEQAVRS